jgi:hypothetical protein
VRSLRKCYGSNHLRRCPLCSIWSREMIVKVNTRTPVRRCDPIVSLRQDLSSCPHFISPPNSKPHSHRCHSLNDIFTSHSVIFRMNPSLSSDSFEMVRSNLKRRKRVARALLISIIAKLRIVIFHYFQAREVRLTLFQHKPLTQSRMGYRSQ